MLFTDMSEKARSQEHAAYVRTAGNMAKKDYYSVLGVRHDASDKEINRPIAVWRGSITRMSTRGCSA